MGVCVQRDGQQCYGSFGSRDYESHHPPGLPGYTGPDPGRWHRDLWKDSQPFPDEVAGWSDPGAFQGKADDRWKEPFGRRNIFHFKTDGWVFYPVRRKGIY